MKKISIFILIIYFILSIPTITYSQDEVLPEFPTLESEYVVLMDADSGEVLYQNNGDAKCHPASTTKLLTALIAVENSSMKDIVTYSQAAVKSVGYGDANASISVGEELTMEQSLYCLMLRSANDAAYGIAEHVGGNISTFASMMNEKAASFGATGTHFTNPSGLTDEFHYTTPYDMALIGRACFNNKTLMNIISYPKMYTIGPTNKSKFTRYYTHRYQMLKGGNFEYEHSCGGKTGYTDAAGNCLVSFAQKGDMRLVCVIMNSSESGRYHDTAKLFDYYFDNYHKVYLDDYDNGISFDSVDVLKMATSLHSKDSVSLSFGSGAYLLLPNKADTSSLKSIVTYADSPAYFGEKGGFACISFYYNQLNVGTLTVFAKTTSTDEIPGINGVVPYPPPGYIDDVPVTYINLMYVIGGAIGIVLITGLVILITRRKHRRFNYASKKLHF